MSIYKYKYTAPRPTHPIPSHPDAHLVCPPLSRSASPDPIPIPILILILVSSHHHSLLTTPLHHPSVCVYATKRFASALEDAPAPCSPAPP